MAQAETPLLKVAHRPPVTCAPGAAVRDAVAAMVENRVGAIVVLDGGRLAGIFTERDLMVKVVGGGRDVNRTRVQDVMERDPVSVTKDTTRREALALMLERHFRHLPVTDGRGGVLGTVSIRNLLQHQFERVTEERDALSQYLAADGPGG
jgi:CBS domain-containing protein